MEQLTESLAAMPVSEQASLGFTAADFILECTYDGVQCDMDKCVQIFINHCLRFEGLPIRELFFLLFQILTVHMQIQYSIACLRYVVKNNHILVTNHQKI